MIEVRVNAYIFKEEVIRFSWNVSNPTATPFTLQFPEMRASILLKVEKVSNYSVAKGDEVLIYDAKGRKRITLLVESFTYLESKGEIELTCEPYLGQLLLEDGIYDISQVKGFDGIVAPETIDKGRYFGYFENEKDYLLARAWSNEYRRDIVPIPFYIYSQSPSQQENERFRYYRPNKSPAPTLQVSDDDIIEYEISSPQPAVTHIKTRQGGRGALHTEYEFPNINKSTDSVNVHTLKGGELYAVEVYKVIDSQIEHKLYWSDGIVTTIDSSQNKVDVIGITRDHYVEMIELTPPARPYLTFQSSSSFTLKVDNNRRNWDGTLYYSTDTTNWSVWYGGTLSSVDNKLYLRGKGNTKITGSSSDYSWVLTGSNIECIGNIENLLDWETVALGNHPTMASDCYRFMFEGCESLTTAPELPATTLTDNCYRLMFSNCKSLTMAPELPATTLASYCYAGMFYGCTSFKVSTGSYGTNKYAWRIPTSETGTTATGWNSVMLHGTGGSFTSDPTINKTYYVENQPVSGLDAQNVSGVRVRNRINSQILLDNDYATGIEKYGIEDSITVVLPSEGTTKKYLLLYGALFANKEDLSKITLGFVISVGASVSISLVEWAAVDEIGTVAQSILRHTVTPDMQLRKVEATADYVRLFYCELTDINDITYIRYIEARIELSNMLAYGIQSGSQVVDGRLHHSPISSVEFNGSKVSLLVNDAHPIAQVDFQMSSLVETYFAPPDLPFYAMSFIPDLKLNGNYVAFDNEGNVYTFSRLDYLATYYFNVAVIDSVGYLNRYVDKVGIYETNYWMATHRSNFFIDERLYLGNKAEPLPTNQSRKVCEGITNEFIAGYIIGNLQNCDLDLIEQEKGRITLTIASFKYYYYLYQTVKVEDFDLPPLMGRIYVVIDGVNYIIRTTSVRLEYDGMYKCIVNGIIV